MYGYSVPTFSFPLDTYVLAIEEARSNYYLHHQIKIKQAIKYNFIRFYMIPYIRLYDNHSRPQS